MVGTDCEAIGGDVHHAARGPPKKRLPTAEKGIELTVGLYSESPEAAKAAIKSGVGMGLLFRDYIEPETLRGDLKIIKFPELEMKVTT